MNVVLDEPRAIAESGAQITSSTSAALGTRSGSLSMAKANGAMTSPTSTPVRQDVHIIEAPDELALRRELQPDFLVGLSERGVEQVPIRRVPAAPRKRHVTRPRVSFVLGASNQQGLGVAFSFAKHDCDGSEAFVASEDAGPVLPISERTPNEGDVDLHRGQC